MRPLPGFLAETAPNRAVAFLLNGGTELLVRPRFRTCLHSLATKTVLGITHARLSARGGRRTKTTTLQRKRHFNGRQRQPPYQTSNAPVRRHRFAAAVAHRHAEPGAGPAAWRSFRHTFLRYRAGHR